MKKSLFILFIICVICNGCSKRELTMTDCVESGLCKAGLTVKYNDSKALITKDFCLNNNHKWYEEVNACYLR